MNEKTIEKSFDEYMKKNYTENYLSNYKREVIDNQRCDFANGVEYYLKNTWHDKSEIPEYGRCILRRNRMAYLSEGKTYRKKITKSLSKRQR